MVDTILAPTEAQIAALMALPQDAPLAVLNLFRFNAKAGYQPGDPEHGTPAAEISGRDAYAVYAEVAGKAILGLGGKVVFSAKVSQMMIGPDDAKWDTAAIMFFPTRSAFASMLSDPGFQAASRHRKAALANHLMLHLEGDTLVG